MLRPKFSSKLTPEYLRIFLVKYGGFINCNIFPNIINKVTDFNLYFGNNEFEYMMIYSDFYMRIVKMFGGVEGIVSLPKPSDDDWFCFLKGIFGEEYTICYAKEFKAHDVVFCKSRFISRFSHSEIIKMIRLILEENNDILKLDMSNTEVIEVESFYKSERRFLIFNRIAENSFYIRLSDRGVVNSRLSYDTMKKLMINKFGFDYISLCNKN